MPRALVPRAIVGGKNRCGKKDDSAEESHIDLEFKFVIHKKNADKKGLKRAKGDVRTAEDSKGLLD